MAAINANSTPKNFLPPPPINSSHQLNPTVKIGQSEFAQAQFNFYQHQKKNALIQQGLISESFFLITYNFP